MILQRHGRTDRQMDGQNSISISRVSVLMRDKVTGQEDGPVYADQPVQTGKWSVDRRLSRHF